MTHIRRTQFPPPPLRLLDRDTHRSDDLGLLVVGVHEPELPHDDEEHFHPHAGRHDDGSWDVVGGVLGFHHLGAG